jgi:hypothetical protein
MRSLLVGTIVGLTTSAACTLAQPLDALSSGACRIDGLMNGDESDVDCGGRDPACPRCRLDATCRADADCTSASCGSQGRCECPSDMVPVGHADGVEPSRSCIDSAEVSQQAFAQFLAACPNGCAEHRPDVCSFDHDFAPRTTEVTSGDKENETNCYHEVNSADRGADMPVVCIDWCAAYTYCAWRGKRLCGRLAGAPRFTEWTSACSYKGTRTYPYAPPEDPTHYDACACNAQDESGEVTCGPDTRGEAMMPADALNPSCAAESGAINLVGNAAEWEDDCDRSTDPKDDKCPLRGGSYASDQSRASCTAPPDFLERSHARTDVGFRCCSG